MSWMSCLLCVMCIYKDITVYCTVKELAAAVQFSLSIVLYSSCSVQFSKVSVQSVTVIMSLLKIVLSLDLGGTRRLQVLENNKVFIKDLATKKCAFFTPPRWKRFVGLINDIEEQIQLSFVGKPINYTMHIGGTWHVSVDSKFPTVDIRRWYEDVRTGLKPTRVGIVLTYPNWDKLKNAIVKVENEIPAMLAISSCWHDSQVDHMFCDECSPFYKVDDVTNVKIAEAAEKLMIDIGSSDDAVDFTQRRNILRTHPFFSDNE